MAKSPIRKKAEAIVFGKCDTCGRTNSPGHTCRMRFTKNNATRLTNRIKKRDEK